MKNHYFGHDEWSDSAPALKSLEDALAIRRRVLIAFEAAEMETDDQARREWLTFVVVGGGPTGVELAGQIGEIAGDTMRNQFSSYDPAAATVLLLEGADRILLVVRIRASPRRPSRALGTARRDRHARDASSARSTTPA